MDINDLHQIGTHHPVVIDGEQEWVRVCAADLQRGYRVSNGMWGGRIDDRWIPLADLPVTITTVYIRTSDTAWAARRNLACRSEGAGDGVHVVAVPVGEGEVEPVAFAGRPMVRFDLGDDLPADYPNRWVLSPAAVQAKLAALAA
ncbi:hypothetical protein [Verrucosispora sp. WMMC514]|uniref:hypothetical protein n=1 Tax=Verrucosispora sp. WMMC514 TaxID=3015156 RepID=UPI00248CB20D|nr:hypothetical protein [Verrucosispora sp. WMMC514]WBB94138.1 hypothetical protein O7597_14915 [Verrucosispora sp. WMMC514]